MDTKTGYDQLGSEDGPRATISIVLGGDTFLYFDREAGSKHLVPLIYNSSKHLA